MYLLKIETREGGIEALTLEVERLTKELQRKTHDMRERVRIISVIERLNTRIHILGSKRYAGRQARRRR